MRPRNPSGHTATDTRICAHADVPIGEVTDEVDVTAGTVARMNLTLPQPRTRTRSRTGRVAATIVAGCVALTAGGCVADHRPLLRDLAAAQQLHYDEHGSYTDDVDVLLERAAAQTNDTVTLSATTDDDGYWCVDAVEGRTADHIDASQPTTVTPGTCR